MLEAGRHPDKAKGRENKVNLEGMWGKNEVKKNGQCASTRCLLVSKLRVSNVRVAIDFTLSRPCGLATVTKFNPAPPQAAYKSVAKGHGRLVSAAKAFCTASCFKAFILVD